MVGLLFRGEFLNHRGWSSMYVYWRLVTEAADACGREAAWRLAQLCVSEIVSDVITHVGRGTPATPAVSVSGTRLGIEVRDPDARALPVLVGATDDAETGQNAIGFYEVGQSVRPAASNRLMINAAETTAVEAIADLLDRLRAHGRDTDEVPHQDRLRVAAVTERIAK
ncbi:hypothetical protein [Streptomyces chrestomyceticus]|uniref:hypothetical protein n=1 Tax=Streptomyces chrestomyceticus TaxID=68185 RepID=UPI00378EE95B